MYTRRFTPLKWFDHMKAHHNLRLKAPPEYFHIFDRNPPVKLDRGAAPMSFRKIDVDRALIEDLLNKYPDLKFTNTTYANYGASLASRQGNYVYDFIQHQRKLMRDGYTKEKAFEMVEKKFHEKFSDKIASVQLATRLAVNNNARSMLSIAQQQAEYEATLKIRRMTRDLPLYEKAQREMNQTLRDLERERHGRFRKTDDGGEENLEDASDFSEDELDYTENTKSAVDSLDPRQQYVAKYTRVLHKIVPELKEDYRKELTKDKRSEIINSFIQNTQNMFSKYYERAATLDKLSGLTDNEIMDAVASNPTRIKRQSKQLLKKLEKYNITLTNAGEVDFSQCSEPNVVNQLKNNPLVKVVLMQADLEYESPHREAQAAAARKVKLEIEQFKKEREIETQELAKEVENARAIENAATGEQSPFHQQFNIEYPRSEAKVIKEAKETAKEKALRFNQDAEEAVNVEAAYRVFETYDERVSRLEKKWLQSRLASLEGGLEKPTQEERSDLLKKAVQKLRRLKFLVDQKNLQNAKDLLFEEHRVFTKSELLVDQNANVEKLADYLKLPEEKRRLQAADEIEDNRILNMVRRKEVHEDTLRPYQDNFAYKLTEEDTFETKIAELNRRRMSRMSSDVSRRAQRQQVEAQAEDDEDVQIEADDDVPEPPQQKTKGKGKTKNKAAKVEKKKLIEFIKETSEKKVAKEAKDAKKNR